MPARKIATASVTSNVATLEGKLIFGKRGRQASGGGHTCDAPSLELMQAQYPDVPLKEFEGMLFRCEQKLPDGETCGKSWRFTLGREAETRVIPARTAGWYPHRGGSAFDAETAETAETDAEVGTVS